MNSLSETLLSRHGVTILAFCMALGPIQSVAFGHEYAERQLSRWLKQFPDADLDSDGRLTSIEADYYRKTMRRGDLPPLPVRASGKNIAPRQFPVDPGWAEEEFPVEAVCYRKPKEIANLYPEFVAVPKPTDGSLRIVGTGHRFMTPSFERLEVYVFYATL